MPEINLVEFCCIWSASKFVWLCRCIGLRFECLQVSSAKGYRYSGVLETAGSLFRPMSTGNHGVCFPARIYQMSTS